MRWVARTCVCSSSSSSEMSLREISENVKLAREYALLGNYSSASVLYQGLLEQINKYVYTVRDGSLQQRWQQVHHNTTTTLAEERCCVCVLWHGGCWSQLWQEISEENRNVLDIMSTLENFQLDPAPTKPSNQQDQDCEIRPVHMDLRCQSITQQCCWAAFLLNAVLHHSRGAID